MEIENPQKTPNEFICITCDFKCCNKKDYNRHLSTRKHKWKSDGNVGNEKKTYNTYVANIFREYLFIGHLGKNNAISYY